MKGHGGHETQTLLVALVRWRRKGKEESVDRRTAARPAGQDQRAASAEQSGDASRTRQQDTFRSAWELFSQRWKLRCRIAFPLWVMSPSSYINPPSLPTAVSQLGTQYLTRNALLVMPAVISNATRIWETNVYWTLYSQCGVWNSKSKGVDVWECIRDHQSTTDTQPPNAKFWRYVARR